MKTGIFLFLICLYSSEAFPSPDRHGSIQGTVVDSAASQPIRGVNITIEGTRQGTTTNRNGTFVLKNIAAGTYTIKFSHIAYAIKKISYVQVSAEQTLNIGTIVLSEKPILLKEIVISPGTYSVGGLEPSKQSLTSEDIEMMGFAEDVTKAVQRVPGIVGDDFSAKFSIRGGDRDEVLFLLDGMQIYKPYHQKDFGGGLFSTIDIEAVQQVDVLTGGFTADYGDRMSGVLNMTSKRPTHGRESSVGLSLTTMKAFTMSPFNNGKGSYLVSARRGYLNILNWLTNNEYKLGPSYYDAYATVEYPVSEHQLLSASVFTAHDGYKLDDKELEPGFIQPNIDFSDTRFGNHYGWITLKSFPTGKLYLRSMAYGGLLTQSRFWDNFDNDPKSHYSKSTLYDKRDFTLVGAKQDGNFDATDNLLIKFGWDAKRVMTNYEYSGDFENEILIGPDSVDLETRQVNARKTLSGNQVALYGSSRFRLLPPITLETGLRFDYASYTGDKLWSPRVNMVYELNKKTFLRGGWGYFYQTQGIDDLKIQYEEPSLHRAQRSEHFVLGLEHFFDNGIYARTEGYVKRITRIPDRYIALGADIDEFYPEARDDLVKTTIDHGTTKGLEFYLKRDTGGKISWWFSYILSYANDDVSAIEHRAPLIERLGTQPRQWDQRHTISTDLNYRPNPGWHFNFAWQYRSGWSYTPYDVVAVKRGDNTFGFFQDFGLFNSKRYPAYHRLDVRINKYFATSKGRLTVYLHVINVYNRMNISTYDYEGFIDENNNLKAVNDPTGWYGLLPFVGATWEF